MSLQSKRIFRVGVIQPNYIPWKGYFHFINSVELFIFFDDVQYTKRDWRNRNRIKVKNSESIWLSVPVRAKRGTLIMDVEVNNSENWARKHLSRLEQNYGKAPYFDMYFEDVREILLAEHHLLVDLNIALCQKICTWLGIQTELKKASELKCKGVKDDKLINMMQAVKGTHYLSGPVAKNYIQPHLWKAAGINLDYMEYPNYPEYPQISTPFETGVSVLDLLFMTGPDAPRYIWGI